MSSVNHGLPHRVAHWVLGMPLVLLPLLVGGARPWFWSMVAALFFIGVAVLLWTDPSSLAGKARWKPTLLVGLLLSYPILQMARMPGSWVETLSPHRFGWLRNTAKILEQPVDHAASISYDPLVTGIEGVFWVFLVVYAWVFRSAIGAKGRLRWLWGLLFVLAGAQAIYGLIQVLWDCLPAARGEPCMGCSILSREGREEENMGNFFAVFASLRFTPIRDDSKVAMKGWKD